MTALGILLREVQSGFACGQEDPEGIFQFRMHNVDKSSNLILSRRRRVPRDAHQKIDDFAVQSGDVLFNATNSPDDVGKSVLVPKLDEPAVFSNHFLRLRPDENLLNAGYLWRWLQYQFQAGTFQSICRRWVNQATVSRERLLALDLSVPTLKEQRRSALLLNRSDAIRSKRRRVLAELEALEHTVFHEMFGRGGRDPIIALGGLASVTSGITKGRRTEESTTSTPYLAVANVQAGHLRMHTVKQIDATDAEIRRYALVGGDLVLTEGGDPDKLGRGTVWRDELPLCLHQNHIFRVRVEDGGRVLPDYLAAYLANRQARSYFLRSAKQTTGIASINMTQLKGLPVSVPPLEKQQHLVARLKQGRAHRTAVQRALADDNELFASLQSRTFRGEL